VRLAEVAIPEWVPDAVAALDLNHRCKLAAVLTLALSWVLDPARRGSGLRFNSPTVLVNAHLVGTEVLVLPLLVSIRSGVTINGMRTIADRNGSGDCEIEAERRGLSGSHPFRAFVLTLLRG
jgi:hypothetical protein